MTSSDNRCTAPSNGLIFAKNKIKPPVEGRCGFFVKRKQRYCKMLPAKGNTYCAEHMSYAEQQDTSIAKKRKRIPCPLDPKHTVFEDKINTHLKKCNATRKTQLPFFEENVNIGIKSYERSEDEKVPLNQVPIEELRELIDKLRSINQDIVCSITKTKSNSIHEVLLQELSTQEHAGDNLRKHLLQQGSLVQILHDIGSLRDNVDVIEFGAGRGTLSHWVQKAMSDRIGCKFFLVDRQHNRNKLDCYHKGQNQGPNFERLNIDIQHLNLNKVELLNKDNLDIVGIGKHLCGGATDLSLRCLLREEQMNIETCAEPCVKKHRASTMRERLHSVMFALCCYHRCTWDTYVGLETLTKLNITPIEFHRMTKMATWSTCGFERRKNAEEHDTFTHKEDETTVDQKINERLHVKLGLSSSDQEEIGRICKFIIDYGRIQYINGYGFQAKLVEYVDRQTTPENVALVINRCDIKEN